MVLSINTNTSAAIALQSLNQTTRDLDEVGNRINTGFKVAGAKDDGAIYSIAQGMRADVEGIGVAIQSLDRSRSLVDVSLAAGESISDLLIEMKGKALAGSDTSITSTDRSAYNEDYKSLLTQINTIINSAEFNGSNLIDGSLTESIQTLASYDTSQRISVAPEDFTAAVTGIGSLTDAGFTDATTASTEAAAVEAALDGINASLARLGTQSKKLELQATFLSKLEDSFTAGIGNLVDANLAKESARLQALQIKQQLGTQALSIANSRPQTIIQLFQ